MRADTGDAAFKMCSLPSCGKNTVSFAVNGSQVSNNRRHLKPDGVLAINASNRYLNLVPIVTGNAQATGMSCVLVEDDGEDEEFYAATSWMLCSREPKIFDDPLFKGGETEHPVPDPKIRPWTDDYSNLFQILKKRSN